MRSPATPVPGSPPPNPKPSEVSGRAGEPPVCWADRPQRDPAFVFRQIAGESILVPIRQNMGDLESVYTLNELGTRVWELLDGARTLGDIRDRLLDEFEVSREALERDLRDFVAQLQALKAVRPAAPPAGEDHP